MDPLIERHRDALRVLAERRGLRGVRVFGSVARGDARGDSDVDLLVFMSSTLVQDAVVRNLETLTESPQRLTDAAEATEPQVPWRERAGFRNVLVHACLGVDLGAVWSVVESDLPPLAEALRRMHARAQAPGGREID